MYVCEEGLYGLSIHVSKRQQPTVAADAGV